MRFLALALFAPLFAIYTWLYWSFPRSLPATRARRRFDATAIVFAIGATVVALVAAFERDYGAVGPIWPQVAATLAAYHVFPVLLIVAWFVRRRWLTRTRP